VPPNDENRQHLTTRDKLVHALHHRGLKAIMEVE